MEPMSRVERELVTEGMPESVRKDSDVVGEWFR